MKRCPYCEAEISNNIKTCKYCGESVTEKNKLGDGSYKNKNKTKFSERVLFLIPNIIILWFILQFIRTMIGIIDYGINPHSIMYKHSIYFKVSFILSIISVFIGIFMLSIPTRKKIYTGSFPLIGCSILILFIIYSILGYRLKEMQEKQQLRQKEFECQMKGYSSCAEMRSESLQKYKEKQKEFECQMKGYSSCAEMQSELRKNFKEFNSSQKAGENQHKTYIVK